MVALSEPTEAFLLAVRSALAARPELTRRFCIPTNLNGSGQLPAIHDAFPGRHIDLSRGALDELVAAGFVRKVDPLDPKNCLHEITEAGLGYRPARSLRGRIEATGGRARRVGIVVGGLLAALASLVAVLTYLGVRP